MAVGRNDNHEAAAASPAAAAADKSAGNETVETSTTASENDGGVIENIDAIKDHKTYPLSYFSGSDWSGSDTYNETLIKCKEDLPKIIFEKLQSKYRMRVGDNGHHKYISRYVDMMFPEELETVVTLLVKAGHIDYPMTCDYDDGAHDDVLEFFEIFCADLHISCEGEDDDDKPTQPGKKRHVSYLFLDGIGMDYAYDLEMNRDEGGFFNNLLRSFDLDECIERLVRLRVLRLSTHCTSLPATLANMTSLHRISIVDTCEYLRPAKPDNVPPLTFPNVTMIHIQTGQRDISEIRGALRFLLLTGSFPSINELSFEIEHDATQVVPDVVTIIESNTCLQQIEHVSWSFNALGDTNQDKNLIPNVFLDLMPRICRVLPEVDELTLTGKEEQLKGVLDIIAERLQRGEYNKPDMTTFCDNLGVLELDFGTNSHAKNQQPSILTILRWFIHMYSVP